MAPRKRLTKKEIRHDPIIEKTLQGWRLISRHRNHAITAAMAVVAVAALWWGVSSYRASRKTETDTDLGRALLQMQIGERAKAVDLLTELATKKRSTEAGKRASFYLACLKFEDGDFAAARELYDWFRRKGPNDPFLRASSGKGVADCDVELGKLSEAGDEYIAVAERYRALPLAPECLYLAGLALSIAGQDDRAAEALQRLIERHPDHARLADARVLLGEVQGRQRIVVQPRGL